MLPFVTIVTAALSLLTVTPCLAAHPPTAIIPDGILVGTTTSLPQATAVVNQFLGIPFAAPPQRFGLPTKPNRWWKPLDVSKRKPSCIQQFNYPEVSRNFTIKIFSDPLPEESEDCLYLNVFAPSSPPPIGGYPIIFWIYGGALQFGNAGQPAYDGSAFAAYEDVIVVTTNYRTNVFGFPNSPEISNNAQNLGLHDQRLALDWVQRNIFAFGGNPKKVTLAGESAGAMSVDTLVLTHPKNPPFRAAVLESGQASLAGLLDQGNGATDWANLAAALNCTSAASPLACLRKVPALSIKSVLEHKLLKFNPVVDNVTFVADPDARRAARNIANVPLLTGNNAQEGRVLTAGETNLTEYLSKLIPVPALVAKIKAEYPIGSPGISSDAEAIAAILTDIGFTCPQGASARLSAQAGFPTWRYMFNATFPNIQPIPGMDLGAFHSLEIPMVFSTYTTKGATAAEVALSNYMRGAWARFARNPAGGPGWAAVGSGPEDLGVLGGEGWAGVRVVPQAVVDAKCGLFAPILGAPPPVTV